MSDFSAFMKKNKIQRENVTYAATKYLKDENGEPLKWEIKPISTKENEAIREECTKEVPVKGKTGQYKLKVDMGAYQAKMISASVVFPDLNNKELQDSYGVMNPEDLLKEMIDDPGEYMELSLFIQKTSGFTTLQEDVEEAKN